MANDDESRNRGQLSDAERAAIGGKAADVGARIEAAKRRHDPPRSANAGQGNAGRGNAGQGDAMGRGLQISAELIGGVVAGALLGWALDKLLGTFPWLFIVCFLLGSAAGILNIVRRASRERTPPAPSVADEDDDS